MKNGYAITTYKMQLNYKHLDWIKATEALFNDVLVFYYDLLNQNSDLLEYSTQNLLRQLELKTIKQRDGTLPENPLPYEKVPLYFRRSAINIAISMMRSYSGEVKAYEKKKAQFEREGKFYKHSRPNPPGKFNVSMVYYKGMYKAFDEKSILLKLYTGKSWVWVKHRYTGRSFPENAELMSPTIVVRKKKVMLHVPVKEVVADIRTAKERVEQHEKLCSVAFSGSDSLAVCTIIEADGSATHPYFIKGGKELAHRRKKCQGYAKRAGNKNPKENNQKYFQKITTITDHYAHEVSRKIIDYAKKYQATLIILPELNGSFENNTKYYLKHSPYDFIGRKIATDTQYKAWQQGIIVMTGKPYYVTSKCSQCGAEILKYNTEFQTPGKNFYGGKNFVCLEGHRGSTALNAARNIGKSFYDAFAKVS